MDVHILIADRETRVLKYNYVCSKWTIESDILTTAQSSFELPIDKSLNNIKAGDYIIAKSYGERFKPTTETNDYGYFNCLYVGIVDSFEASKITARPLSDMFNISVPLPLVWRGDNPGEFISNIAGKYVFTKDRYLESTRIFNSSYKESGWNVIQDKPKVYNLINILQNLYKSTGYFIDTLGYMYDRNNRQISFAFIIDKSDDFVDTLFLSRNMYFKKTKFYIRPENTANPNAINILYNNINYSYYLSTKGYITDDWTDNTVVKPVSKQGYIYDSPAPTTTQTEITNPDGSKTTQTTEQPKEIEPSPEDIARRELKNSEYQHEIEFSLLTTYPGLNKLMNLGAKVKISYGGKVYDSSITKLHLDSESSSVALTCGNIRSTIQFALDELSN